MEGTGDKRVSSNKMRAILTMRGPVRHPEFNAAPWG
jgi:hypothetical protein